MSCSGSQAIMPYKTDTENNDFAGKIFLTKFQNDKGDIVTSSWRELILVKKNSDLYIVPKENGKIFDKLVVFYFKNSSGLSIEQVHFEKTQADLDWLKKNE